MKQKREVQSPFPLLPLCPFARIRPGVRPLYRRAAEWLTASLCGVPHPERHRLPGERELVVRSGLSLVTVKHALADLAADGLVARRHGSGSYPLRRPTVEDLLRAVRPTRLGFYSVTRLHMLEVLRYDLLFFLQKFLAAAGANLVPLAAADAADALDGVFVAGNPGPSAVRPLASLPLVFIGSLPPRTPFDFVGVDLDDVAARAAEEFRAMGARRIGFFGAQGQERSVSRRILRGLRARLGPAPPVDEFTGDVDGTYRQALAWLRGGVPPFFAFAAFALCTGAIIRASEAAGLRIGKDVHLVAQGAYNVVLEDLAPVRILCPPRQRMAEAALELMLLRIMAPEEPPRHAALPVELL